MGGNLHEMIKGPAIAVDTVVLGIDEARLKVLLIKIGSGEYADKWALPGGLIALKESLDQAAVRVLKQKVNVNLGHLEQVYSFGDVDRDSRGQVVSVAYMLLVDDIRKIEAKTSDYYVDIAWFDTRDLPAMAFDHKKIIELTVKRLMDKLSYSTITSFLMPKSFTLTELQKVHEIILGREIDKRNFRKKVLMEALVEPTKEIRRGISRPAQMYKFKKKGVIYY